MAVLIEVIMDRGVDGGKFVEGFHASEIRHCLFPSSERLVGILSPIVQPATALPSGRVADPVPGELIPTPPPGADRGLDNGTATETF